MKFWIPLLFLAAVLLTNRLIVDDPDMSIHGYDSKSYVQIAEAFPNLSQERMPHQHAQRLVGPWIVGGLIKISPLSFFWTFEVITVLLLFALLVVNWRICERLGVGQETQLIVLALLTFNPYFSRFYFAIPTYIGDLLFMLGMSLTIEALLFKKVKLLLAALTLAAVGRQTAILLLPAVCLWVLLNADWKTYNTKFRLGVATVSSLIVFGIYFVTDWVAYKVNPVSINAEHVLGLFTWIGKLMRGADPDLDQQLIPIVPRILMAHQTPLAAFIVYLFRGLLSLMIPLAMIFAIAGWRKSLIGQKLNYSLLLFMSATILVQPFLAGPSLTGHPVIRLGMFALPALVIAFSLLTKEYTIKWKPGILAALLVILFISSFHHRYTWLWNGTLDQSPVFAALYFACAIVSFILFKRLT